MSTGLLLGYDDTVASWYFRTYGIAPFKFDRALGLMTDGRLEGAIIFNCYNGNNIELSYYGKGTMTAGVVRCIARFILATFNPSRLTVLTSKKNRRYIRSFQRLGFRLEGLQRRYYGHRDCNRNSAVRFVMFRERIEQIAKMGNPDADAASTG